MYNYLYLSFYKLLSYLNSGPNLYTHLKDRYIYEMFLIPSDVHHSLNIGKLNGIRHRVLPWLKYLCTGDVHSLWVLARVFPGT